MPTVIEKTVIENFGWFVLGAMTLVAFGIITVTWIASENGRDYIKPDKDPQDATDDAAGNTVIFERCVAILISLGVALLSSSLTAAFFAGNAGIKRLGESGNYSIYMLICVLIGLVTIIVSSILLSVIDTEAEVDGKKTDADGAMIASIVIASVCTVVGVGIYFGDSIMAGLNAGVEKAKNALESQEEKTDFGFEFEF